MISDLFIGRISKKLKKLNKVFFVNIFPFYDNRTNSGHSFHQLLEYFCESFRDREILAISLKKENFTGGLKLWQCSVQCTSITVL